jgi:hypothetical protein
MWRFNFFLVLILTYVTFNPYQLVWAQSTDIYKTVFDQVDRTNLIYQLKNLSGVNPVNVAGSSFSISERYSPSGKKNFRDYFTAYFEALGYVVKEQPFKTLHANGEEFGHNIEAVLPGKSADSIVIIVHYDSMGPAGSETSNPGADDDMTGMSVSFETAKLLAQHKATLEHTVRFVAADYEEWSQPEVEGARIYASYIKNLALSQGFKVISSIDNEQIGWNCAGDGTCTHNPGETVVDVDSCSADNLYHFPQIGDAFEALAKKYSTVTTRRICLGDPNGANSDMYAMWEVGVPSVMFVEHNVLSNDHFDASGGDTFERIDQDYFYKLAQLGVTFAVHEVGIQGK